MKTKMKLMDDVGIYRNGTIGVAEAYTIYREHDYCILVMPDRKLLSVQISRLEFVEYFQPVVAQEDKK